VNGINLKAFDFVDAIGNFWEEAFNQISVWNVESELVIVHA